MICISRLRQGDMQGLEPVYREYGRLIYSAALQVCRQPDTAEDIVSEFFLRLTKAAHIYKKGDKGDGFGGHKKWLIASVRNLAVDHLRKNRRDILVSGGEEDEDDPLAAARSQDTEEARVADITVEEIMEALPQSEREVANLKIYCGFTLREIADILHIPPGTAAWRYNSAVKKLRKLYGEA